MMHWESASADGYNRECLRDEVRGFRSQLSPSRRDWRASKVCSAMPPVIAHDGRARRARRARPQLLHRAQGEKRTDAVVRPQHISSRCFNTPATNMALTQQVSLCPYRIPMSHGRITSPTTPGTAPCAFGEAQRQRAGASQCPGDSTRTAACDTACTNCKGHNPRCAHCLT